MAHALRKILCLGLAAGLALGLADACTLDSRKAAPRAAGNPAPGAAEAGGRLASIPPGAEKMTPRDDPMRPVLHGRGWEQPVPLGPPVNSPGGEDAPFITPDGNTLFFFFTPSVKVPAHKQLTDGVTGIYVSRKGPGGWEPPVRVVLQDPDRLALDGCPFFQDGTLYFCSAREGNRRELDIWMADARDGAWSNWRLPPEPFNEAYRMGEMHIAADGSQVYFSSDRPGGKGKRDLWVGDVADGKLGPPRNLAQVNSAHDENQPFVSEDGSELWFTSDSRILRGTPAVFRSVKTGNGWSPPEEIVTNLCGEPTLDREGNLYFTHHYFRNGQHVEADIYVARKKPQAAPAAAGNPPARADHGAREHGAR